MKKAFMFVAIVVMGLAASVPFTNAAQDQAQTAGDHVGRGRGPGGPMGRGGRMGGPMGFGEVMRDLTDAQRDQVKAIREKHAGEMKPLLERTRTAREAIDNAVMSGNIANLQALSIEVGNAETELTFAQAKVQSEIFSVLTAEQKQRIAERRKEMEQRRQEMMKRRQERAQ